MTHELPQAAAKAVERVRDPVCGMMVDPATAVSTEHDGKTYHFCCDGCRDSFVAAPDKYLNAKPFVLPPRPMAHGHDHAHHHHAPAAAPAPATVPAGTQWTCPMHPEVLRDGPGDCPLCGMALEPVMPTLDDAPNPELADFSRRLVVSAALSLPLLVLSMGELVGLDFHRWLGPAFAWLQLALASPVVLWAALPFFRRFIASLRNRSPNMWTLIGLGVGAAYLFSVVATIAPQLFPMGGMDGAPLYFEAAAVIVTLVFVGQVLELRAREQTGKAIRALLDLAPKTARRIAHGHEMDVPLAEVRAFLERRLLGHTDLSALIDQLVNP
ncbi:MAG: YHS domain-containing protein [Devosia sp.]